METIYHIAEPNPVTGVYELRMYGGEINHYSEKDALEVCENLVRGKGVGAVLLIRQPLRIEVRVEMAQGAVGGRKGDFAKATSPKSVVGSEEPAVSSQQPADERADGVDLSEYITVQQAAAERGCSDKSIYAIPQRRLPMLRVDKRLYIKRSDWQAYQAASPPRKKRQKGRPAPDPVADGEDPR